LQVLESLTEPIGRSSLSAGRASAVALGEALSSGVLTAAELAAFYVGRIERLNPALRAVISVSPAAAKEAAASDARRHTGHSRGLLDGIPVLIKDNIQVAGQPATAGSPALVGADAGDAFLISQLRAAGAVILGKANLSEWAGYRSWFACSGWSTLGGQAVNPHGTSRSPSGSSSGSASAIAAGLAPLTVGTETDGSIVLPASACGVVGIKPTLGLVSRTGIVPASLAQDTAGPMAKTVADAALLLGAMAGRDQADPATADASGRPTVYMGYLVDSALAGARLGVWRAGSQAANPPTMAVLDSAIALLRASGAQVFDPVDLPGAKKIQEPLYGLDPAGQNRGQHRAGAFFYEFKHDLNAYLAALPGKHPSSLAELIVYNTQHSETVLAHFGQDGLEVAEATSGNLEDPDYVTVRARAWRLARGAIDAAIENHKLDAIVSLTSSPAWLIDYTLGDHHPVDTATPAAVAGYPAVSVPAGQVHGLPVGISFVGPAWSEPRLIGLAYSFEQARASLHTTAGRRPDPGPQ
jgi:amidase